MVCVCFCFGSSPIWIRLVGHWRQRRSWRGWLISQEGSSWLLVMFVWMVLRLVLLQKRRARRLEFGWIEEGEGREGEGLVGGGNDFVTYLEACSCYDDDNDDDDDDDDDDDNDDDLSTLRVFVHHATL